MPANGFKADLRSLKHELKEQVMYRMIAPQLWCWGWAYSTLSPSTNSHYKQANDT
jgi:hypothetical protein